MGLEVLIAASWPAILVGLILSFLIERWLMPVTRAPWLRPPATWAIHMGLWLLLYGFAFMLWRRPYFTAFNILLLQLLIVMVSNAKFHSLREPFVYSDFEYFIDAIRHPRLYLPFFGVKLAIGLTIGYLLIVCAGLSFERSLDHAIGNAVAVWLFAWLIAVAGALIAWLGGRARMLVSFDAISDLERLGMAAALWHYAAIERMPFTAFQQAAPFASCKAAKKSLLEMPDLVVVQSESFFDVRRLYDQVRPEVLQHYDALRAEAFAKGRLGVAAWGANTVRTEFSFLSGMGALDLGVHRFNPYRRLARNGVPTIASSLQKLGYRTVCLHPYVGSFYGRDRILPQLGFDAFLDISDFAEAEKFGPYTSDQAIAEKVIAMLDVARDQPLFIYAITMENHGPLHWETLSEHDHDRFMRSPLPDGCDDLVTYVRHLANADQMFASITAKLRSSERAAGFCLFGDHVPIMADVYRAMGEPAGATDYLLWSNRITAAETETDQNVEDIAQLFLRRMGLHS